MWRVHLSHEHVLDKVFHSYAPGSRPAAVYPWRSTAITLPDRPRTDSLDRVSVQLMGVLRLSTGLCVLSLPILRASRCSHSPKHLFLEKCKHFHSKGRHQKAEEHYRCTWKPHPYFSILKPSGQLTTQQKRQRAGQAAPQHQRVLRHRCAEKWIYCTASCSLPNAKRRWEASPFQVQTLHAALFSCALKEERMSVGHSFILVLLSLFKTQKVFAQSQSLLWSPPCSAVEQQLRRAPYPHYCVGQTATTAIAISSNTITTSIPGKDETTLRLLPSSFTIGLLQLNSSSESCSSSQLRQIFPRAYPVQAPHQIPACWWPEQQHGHKPHIGRTALSLSDPSN